MELVAILWLGLLIAFVVVEAACPIHLVSIWFAAGSLAALVVYWLHGPLWLQVLVFLVVSGGLLFSALFTANDYSTTPITGTGKIIF